MTGDTGEENTTLLSCILRHAQATRADSIVDKEGNGWIARWRISIYCVLWLESARRTRPIDDNNAAVTTTTQKLLETT